MPGAERRPAQGAQGVSGRPALPLNTLVTAQHFHVMQRLAFTLKALAVLVFAVGPPAAPALAALLLGVLSVPVACSPHNLRLLRPLELALDVLQPLCACALFHRLYPSTPGAGPLRALACVLAGNGVLALAWRAKASPLTFRWQLPAVLATGTVLLAHTRHLCTNSLLQHGFRLLHTLARILLPVVAPALIGLSPPNGFAALLAPAPAADAEGAAVCAAYHASSVLLGCAALLWHLHSAEASLRKALLARGVAPALPAGTTADGGASSRHPARSPLLS